MGYAPEGEEELNTTLDKQMSQLPHKRQSKPTRA